MASKKFVRAARPPFFYALVVLKQIYYGIYSKIILLPYSCSLEPVRNVWPKECKNPTINQHNFLNFSHNELQISAETQGFFFFFLRFSPKRGGDTHTHTQLKRKALPWKISRQHISTDTSFRVCWHYCLEVRPTGRGVFILHVTG